MSKGYNSKKSAKAYTSCTFSKTNITIHDANSNPNGGGYLLSPDDVSIDTKNYYFEKFHEDNYLLTSIRYGLRVCIPNQTQLIGLLVRLELVDDRTNQEVICVKRERAGKRVLKGKTKEEFDISKHGNLKTKLDFRFRETSTDNIVEWFRLNIHIVMDNQKLLTFTSEPFRTSVRSPTKKTIRQIPPPLNPTVVQMGGAAGQMIVSSSSRRSLEDEDEDDIDTEEDDSGVEEDDDYSSPPPQQKKVKSLPNNNNNTLPNNSSQYQPQPPAGFPFLPPYNHPTRQ